MDNWNDADRRVPPLPVGVEGVVLRINKQAVLTKEIEQAVLAKEIEPDNIYHVDIEMSNLKQQISGITNGLKRLDRNVNSNSDENFDLKQHFVDLQRKVTQIEERISQIEKREIIEFKRRDVYEVNKRIERLEAKVALIVSNSKTSFFARFLGV